MSVRVIAVLHVAAGLGLIFAQCGPSLMGAEFGGFPAKVAVGALFLASGVGVLFRQRWAMFLGLLALVIVAASPIPSMVDALPQASQPGNFAALAVTLYLVLLLLCAVPFVVLLRAIRKR